MPASKRATPPASSDSEPPLRGKTNLAALDDDIITREEYEDIPEVDVPLEEFDQHYSGVLVKRGRPRTPRPKVLVSLRLSPEVLEHFRASGAGWQTRINDILRAVVSFERDEAERKAKAVGG